MRPEEIGRILRERREALGLDIREVQAATKIREKYIRAIEEGDPSVMPAPVYTKGFVRALGNHLGLDGFELMQQYSTEEPAPGESSTKPGEEKKAAPSGKAPSKRPPERPRRRRRRSKLVPPPAGPPMSRAQRRSGMSALLIIVFVLAILVGGGYAINHFMLSNGFNGNDTQAQTPTDTQAPGTQTGPETQAPGTGSPGAGEPPSTPSEPVLTVDKTVNTEARTIEFRLGAQDGQVPEAVELQVDVSGRCWVRVTSHSSEDVIYEGTLVSGERKTWTDPLGITVRAGAPGALYFRLNSLDVGTPVDKGVWNLVFRLGEH